MSRGLAPTRPNHPVIKTAFNVVRALSHANDNEAPGRAPQSDTEIRAALGHFAQHHLNAAHDAHARAQAALSIGDEENFVFWANICRALDRRLAGTLSDAWGRPT